jgi:TRAP-type mannitol/chloroaromatic compound transport system permease small subunit
MSALKQFATWINFINNWVGKIVSFLVFPMIGVLCWEVFLRYVFNRPTIWAHEISALLYAVFFLLGGAYTLRWKAHINVDILYNRFSKRNRAIIDLFTWSLFYLFCIVMLIDGSTSAWTSMIRMERASTVWEPYIWPVKLCIPLSALLILLQGISKTLSDFFIALTGRDPVSDEDK